MASRITTPQLFRYSLLAAPWVALVVTSFLWTENKVDAVAEQRLGTIIQPVGEAQPLPTAPRS